MRSIFISYRRDDSEGQSGRLYDDLSRRFGKGTVFMDVVGIEPGVDFRKVIDKNVTSCGVLLAVIGPSWLDAKNETGQRRIDNPMDFVRLETATALKRDVLVMPVLVHGAKMPKPEQLPDDLKDLAYRNALELTHARWNSDIEVLIKVVSRRIEKPKTPPKPAPAAPPKPVATVSSKPVATAPPRPVPPAPLPQPQPVDSYKESANESGGWGSKITIGVVVIAIIVGVVMRFVGSPEIESVSPNQGVGLGGTAVAIHGKGLKGATKVSFGPLNAKSYRVVSDNEIDAVTPVYAAKIPPAGAQLQATVCVNDRCSSQSQGANFTYYTAPAFTFGTPNFAGTWVEVDPSNGTPPTRLQITQFGSLVTFNNQQATIVNGAASVSHPMSCAPQFRTAGFNYDGPGLAGPSTFTVRLVGSQLLYDMQWNWSAPCGGHPIGLEQKQVRLQREVQ